MKANTKVVPVTSYRAEPCPASVALLAQRRCTLLTDGARRVPADVHEVADLDEAALSTNRGRH